MKKMLTELLVLVDENDNELGTIDKITVHEKGLLHRAFSLFVFNGHGQLLLQKRAQDKYHSGGLWSNTCCSHPVAGESIENAVTRRLYEEMGITATAHFLFKFIYKTEFDNGLKEHEFDHVYIGYSNELPQPDPAEVEDWRYVDPEDLEKEIEVAPGDFTFWLKECLHTILLYRILNRNYSTLHCKEKYEM